MKALNHFYREQPALWQVDFDSAGFAWIEANDADQSVYSYIRYAATKAIFGRDSELYASCPRDYRVGVPKAGYIKSCSIAMLRFLAGRTWAISGGVESEEVASHSQAHSIRLRLPPLAILILKLSKYNHLG